MGKTRQAQPITRKLKRIPRAGPRAASPQNVSPFDPGELLAHVHDSIIVTDLDGTIRSWNAGAERVYGYSSAEVIGKNIELLYFPEEAHLRETALLKPLRSKDLHELRLRDRRKDGSEIFVSIRASVLRDPSGAVIGLVGCSNDITQQKNAEDALLRLRADLERRVEERTRDLTDVNRQLQDEMEERRRVELALRASQERLQHLLRESPGVLYSCEPAHDFAATFTSDNVAAVFGYPTTEFVQTPSFWLDHVHPEDRERVLREAATIIEAGQHNQEYRFLHGDGTYRIIRDSAVAVRDDAGTVVEIVGYCADITGEKRAEQVRWEQEKLHFLTEALLTTQEAERKRISRELHDDLNQRLAVLILEIGLLERGLPKTGDAMKAELKALKARAADISDEVRRIALRLHSAGLDQLGLKAALEHECAIVSDHTEIQTEFTSTLSRELPEHVALCLYRVAQECLRNIVRHSKARLASVRLEDVAGAIELTVTDDGVGFDPREVRGRQNLGFISMSERIRSVNGTLLVDSGGGQGTQVKVRVPLPQ
jgi:PAS domain S-box-containing protein